MQVNTVKKNTNESGNVLFLILIAVALFAALSYAVTQSTRSGGDGATSETSLINSAQVTQYPATVRTAIIRLIIKGNDYQEFEFNPPSLYSDCTAAFANCVFHPSGGGATYVEAPANIMATGSNGTWHYNMNFEVVNIGTSVAGDDQGNEVIAFLPGLTRNLCDRINEELGITGDTTAGSDLSTEYEEDMHHDYSLPGTETVLGGAATSTEGLAGQPFGCFQNDASNSGEYVYYHVLFEQ